MSEPKSAPVSTPAGATPPFGPIHPLVMASRLDAVEDLLNQADVLIDVGKPLVGKQRITAAGASLTELANVSHAHRAGLNAIGDVMNHSLALIGEGSGAHLPSARVKINEARDSLAAVAALFRAEHDRREAADRADTTIAADVAREPLRSVDHPAGLSGYALQAELDGIARAEVRRSRRRWDPRRYVSFDSVGAGATVVLLTAFVAVMVVLALNALGVL